MRTLIVDNHDSFTYNLFQSMAEITGTEPIVLRNDAPGWRPEMLGDVGNVIISPGPGRPENPADFGISRDVVLNANLPLLGVCLGHQGLCHLSGGSVGPAPEVYHGRLSEVYHDGSGIFAGIPSPLRAVRYHSLAVSALPGDLEATAWTRDGVVMGVRHRHRPAWGVQFHPESICTEYGTNLLRNFAELSVRWHEARGRRLSPATPRPAGSRRTEGRGRTRSLRVLADRIDTGVPSEAVFEDLYSRSEHAYWLDSSRTGGTLGRFSFMGDAAGPLARVAQAGVGRGTVTVRSGRRAEVIGSAFFDWLDADLRSMRVEAPELPFEFALGWVGYLGYELKAECGGAPAHPSDHPDAAMIFADRAVAFDHRDGAVYLLALAEDGDEAPAREWLRRTRERIGELAGRPRPAAEPPRPSVSGPLELRHDRSRYLELISRCQEKIVAGETYEVCLTNQVGGRGTVDPWDAYRILRRESPAPFAVLLRMADLSVLSTSPERFMRVSRTGVAESRPIKGTRPRDPDPAEDRRLREELRGSEKDRAENLMIVDLVRNDLGRCAVTGSVEVPRIFGVESYATVHQLVSTVRARLRPGLTAAQCVRAAFPGGSMTGAPKIRTMEIIDELEAGPRGVYSGAIGYFSLNGAADLSIVIRTMVVTPSAFGFGVGGAITALSDPDAEFEETAVKAAAMLRLLGAGFPERTGAGLVRG